MHVSAGSYLTGTNVLVPMCVSPTVAVVAYRPQISACSGTAGRFCEQVHRSKLISLAAGISASSAAFVKDVRLPFSVWPVSSDDYC